MTLKRGVGLSSVSTAQNIIAKNVVGFLVDRKFEAIILANIRISVLSKDTWHAKKMSKLLWMKNKSPKPSVQAMYSRMKNACTEKFYCPMPIKKAVLEAQHSNFDFQHNK